MKKYLFSLLLEMLVMPPMAFAISRGMYHKSKLFAALYAFFLLGIFLPFQVRMMPLMKLLRSLPHVRVPVKTAANGILP